MDEENRPLAPNEVGELVLEVIRSRPIIRRQAENTPRGESDQRLRDLVLEIKGIDLAAV